MPVNFKRMLFFVFPPLFIIISINQLTHNSIVLIRYLLAASPILIVLVTMILFRIPGQYAGPIGLLTGVLVAYQAFGLSPEVLWVSQIKGLLLTLFVLAVFWPALLLYNTVNQADGIQSIAFALESLITDHGILLIVIAWAFSSMLEGLAGFGVPIAIISPMLISLGVPPVLAVSSVAIGHAWSVTFGDMGVVFQTLSSVVTVNPNDLAVDAAIMLGIACLACGFAVAHIFKRMDRWPVVIILALIMSFVQYICAVNRLPALASFSAGLSGVLGGIVISRVHFNKNHQSQPYPKLTKPLKSALLSYGLLIILMVLIMIIQPINHELGKLVWNASFPELKTLTGFITLAVTKQTYYPLLHPGTSILLVTLFSYIYNQRSQLYNSTNFLSILTITFKSSWPATVGILSMVGLSELMDHTGMTLQLADVISNIFQSAFPLVSPYIGMLGAFATGSNNNSNVLFGSLQEGIALLLHISPAIIVAAQTTGGSLGSMIAPAKIIVGCSTVNLQGRDGEIIRKTIPYGIMIGLVMGIVTLILINLKS